MARTPDLPPAGRREPLPPTEVPPTVGAPVPREAGLAPLVEVDQLWFTRIDDAVRSLRAAVAVAVVLALAAGGIAVWALIKANSANDRSASVRRVAALNDRVAALEQRVNGLNPAPVQAELAKRATTGDVNALRQQLQKTQADVARLSSTSTTTSGSITQVNQRVDRLAQQVAQLQSKQGSNSTTTGTSTTP